MLYHGTSALLLSTTSIKYRAFPILIYNFLNTSMVKPPPPAFFVTYCPMYKPLLHKPHLPPIIHNIPSNNLHTPIHNSTKNQHLPQFTYLTRLPHIHRTMWVQYEKYMAAWLQHIMTASIKYPGHPALLTMQHLTNLKGSTFQTKNKFSSKNRT